MKEIFYKQETSHTLWSKILLKHEREREPFQQRFIQVNKGYSTIILYHIQRSLVGFFQLCKLHCKMGNSLVCASHSNEVQKIKTRMPCGNRSCSFSTWQNSSYLELSLLLHWLTPPSPIADIFMRLQRKLHNNNSIVNTMLVVAKPKNHDKNASGSSPCD
jgi:hypothetical protein